VAATLSLVGEKWALLAIREISFGNRRFDQIARNTGAPRDRLAARLRALEAAGVIVRRRYSDHPPRYEYELTPSGEDLRTVLTALRSWGDKWAVDVPPSTFTHSCGHDLDAVMTCRHCGAEVKPGELELHMLTPGWDRRGPVPADGSASDPQATVLRQRRVGGSPEVAEHLRRLR
jgi:DNA-binding HxlR family transcriptional regulator